MPTVEFVTAYHELDTPAAMRSDAAQVGAHLPCVAAAPSYADVYAGWPKDAPKPELSISEAAQRLANALHLHLD